jgi:hypothetical protein
VAERVNLQLSMPDERTLKTLMEATGEGKTAVIRRALQLYALYIATADKGGSFYLKESPDAELERLHIL